MNAVLGIKVLIYNIHASPPTLGRSRVGNHCPGIALDENFAFFVLLASDFESLGGDASEVPLSVPQFLLTRSFDFLGQGGVLRSVVVAMQKSSCLDKRTQGPVVHEGHHGALSATEVQTIVPVRPKSLADAGRADLFSRKVQRTLEMLIDRRFACISERH